MDPTWVLKSKGGMMVTTCRVIEGGKPLCPLGCIADNFSVEIRGAPFDVIYGIQRGIDQPRTGKLFLDREYDTMLILEAPGQEEDRKGYPTVGEAGKYLTKFLLKSGFDISRVYITYIIRCRPPANRKPTVTEINSCYPYTEEEIKRIKPKVIMLLGNSSLKLFKLEGLGGIFKIRGKVYDLKLPTWEDGPIFKVIPTFHPGTFLHNPDPASERRSQDDYILAANISKGLAPRPYKKCNFRILQTLSQVEEAVNEMVSSGFVAFDTESRSINWRIDPVTCMSFCWGYEKDKIQTAVLPIFRHSPTKNEMGWNLEPFWKPFRGYIKDLIELLRRVFEDPKISKAAQQLKYDYSVLKKWFGIEVKGTFYDTLIMAHLLREQRPHNLEYLADLEYGIGDYSIYVHKIVGYGKSTKPWDLIPDHILWPYAAQDAECVYRLAKLYYERLQQKPHLLSFYLQRSRPLMMVFQENEWEGIKVNTSLAKEMKSYYDKNQDELLAKIRSQTTSDFNPGSHDQIAKMAIKDGFGEFVKDEDKAKGYTTSKDVLIDLSNDWPLAKDIIQYKSNIKTINTYLVKAIEDLDSDGRIRKSFLQHGAKSGRASCEFLHQIPRINPKLKYNIRDLFIAEDGYSFIYGDYKGIELKVFSILVYLFTGDKSLMDLFLDPNINYHAETAATLLGVTADKISEENRTVIGKGVNFGIIYGSEGYSLVGLPYEDPNTGETKVLDWDKVNIGINNFRSRFPGAKEYFEYIVNSAIENEGTCINVLGRELHMGDRLIKGSKKEIKAAERKLVNFTVQSVAAQITFDTISLVRQKRDELIRSGNLKPGQFKLLLAVHDSLKSEVLNPLVSWAMSFIRKIGERPIPELNNQSFTIDIGEGKTWSEAEAKKVHG